MHSIDNGLINQGTIPPTPNYPNTLITFNIWSTTPPNLMLYTIEATDYTIISNSGPMDGISVANFDAGIVTRNDFTFIDNTSTVYISVTINA